jgi:hypothetical protein
MEGLNTLITQNELNEFQAAARPSLVPGLHRDLEACRKRAAQRFHFAARQEIREQILAGVHAL